MTDKVLDSIVEITSQRDSSALGISILATIAEFSPTCFITLYQGVEFPTRQLNPIHTLTGKEDENGIKQYLWEKPIPQAYKKYVDDNLLVLTKLSVYQTEDDIHHVFIPIINENKVVYAIDVSSEHRLSKYLDTLVAVAKVCENFYTVLATSERDTLTGLLNRRTYESKLTSLLSNQYTRQRVGIQRPGNVRHPLDLDYTWLAVVDIDHFKQVNDKFGHIYGDEVLLVLSQLMRQVFRENDLLFRFGGEEFVIIFEPITKEQAETALNKFINVVRNHKFPMVGKVTVSIGFAKIMSTDHPTTILDNADKALYYAKENGRDCLYSFENLIEQGLVKAVNIEGDIELF
ncbi:GGDEF domain-containing protein [Thalassotalea sp. M1531]|uniref:diguanylate cyclase n=1 Tax=Thalassotalea algicola TaxID=2716224 RepID=A0A7Y0LHB9_9GAMM|nr:GGDEF domain-containing protein [Thalassotalea algicola]NMP33265.1 GGDEF domain-containing protein [Thalassotalea algicola]